MRNIQVADVFYPATNITSQDVRYLKAKGGIITKQSAYKTLAFKVDYQITFLGHFTIGEDLRQNSDFSPENPDATESCERPYRRPIRHAPVAHEGMIAELHGSDR